MGTTWHTVDTAVKLGSSDIQVWCARVAAGADALERYNCLLSPAEAARAAGIRSRSVRQSFITGRGVLRELLGRELDCSPQELRINTTTRGKPFLEHVGRLHFSLSHSGVLLLIGITRACAIGIDIQAFKPRKPVLELARRFFPSREQCLFNGLSPGQQTDLFYRMWAMKESYVKATGEGLAELESVELALAPDQPPRINYRTDIFTAAITPPLPGYTAALTALGQPSQVRCFIFDRNSQGRRTLYV